MEEKTLPEVLEPQGDSLLEKYRAMTPDQRRECLRSGMRMVVESFVQSAFVLRAMEEEGDDMGWVEDELTTDIVGWLRKIAYGTMDAKVVVAFYKRAKVVNFISRLPVPDQQKLVEQKMVDMVILRPDGTPDKIPAKLTSMDDRQLRQVFDDNRIRSEAEQRLYLESQRQEKSIPAPERVGPFEIDHERKVAYYTGKRSEPISAQVAAAVVAALKK